MNLIYWLLCILIGVVPALLVYRRDSKKKIPIKWLPALLRFFICFSTAVLLLAPALPSTKEEEEKPLLVWLQDNSASMKRALGKDSVNYKKQMMTLHKQWANNYNLVVRSFGPDVTSDTVFSYNQKSTNIGNALQAVVEQYQDRNIGAVILSSDGVYNEGMDPLYAPLNAAVPVFTIALGDSTQPKDASIVRVHANKTVALNSEFEVIIDAKAFQLANSQSEIQLQQQGNILARAPLKIDNDRFHKTVTFRIKANAKGFQRYTAVIPALEGEPNTANNKMDFFVEVIDDEVKVLLLAAGAHPDIAAIRSALESVPQYKVTLVMGTIPQQMQQYDLVIAHQVPYIGGQTLDFGTLPVWYILGKQSNLTAFNQMQQSVKITGGGRPNDVLPELNTAFNYFSLHAAIREALGKMPPLSAPYGNYTVVGNSQSLLKQRIGNVITDYPLWVVNNDATPQAVLCGEGLWRWRVYEYKQYGKNEVVDELIRQTVSMLRIRKDKRPFRVYMDKHVYSDNEQVYVYAELRNDNGELITTPNVTLTITDTLNKRYKYNMEKNGNSYRLNAGLLSPGKYNYNGSVSFNGKSNNAEGGFVVEHVPLEDLRQNSDYHLMAQLAKQSGGQFFTLNTMAALNDSLQTHDMVKPIIHSDKTYEEFIDKKWLFFLILLIAAAEWLLRKYWSV